MAAQGRKKGKEKEMKSRSAARVCFRKADTLFAKGFIHLSDFIFEPPRALSPAH